MMADLEEVADRQLAFSNEQIYCLSTYGEQLFLHSDLGALINHLWWEPVSHFPPAK
jgi:hypothetical protein